MLASQWLYFAERPEIALYEAICRREAVGVSYALMAKRSLLSVQASAKLSLLDLRPHASSWPVLHSLRFDQTQALAAVAHAAGFSGIVYTSAQQYGRDCFALWRPALKALLRIYVISLVEPGAGNLHVALATALNGSRLPLLPYVRRASHVRHPASSQQRLLLFMVTRQTTGHRLIAVI